MPAAARASVTPGRSRPVSCSQAAPRSRSRSAPGFTAGCIEMGVQISASRPVLGPAKPGGATPTTLKTVPLRVTVRPRTRGSAAKCCFQKPSPITATGLATRSSSGSKARPRAGCTPSVEK